MSALHRLIFFFPNSPLTISCPLVSKPSTLSFFHHLSLPFISPSSISHIPCCYSFSPSSPVLSCVFLASHFSFPHSAFRVILSKQIEVFVVVIIPPIAGEGDGGITEQHSNKTSRICQKRPDRHLQVGKQIYVHAFHKSFPKCCALLPQKAAATQRLPGSRGHSENFVLPLRLPFCPLNYYFTSTSSRLTNIPGVFKEAQFLFLCCLYEAEALYGALPYPNEAPGSQHCLLRPHEPR